MEYNPNIKLLNDHGTDGSYEKWKKINNLLSVYYLSFSHNDKIFNYIGGQHTTNKTSDTFKMIKKVIDKYKPELIVLEGVSLDKGFSPELKYFQGEGLYAIKVSRKYKSEYIGVEDNENKLLKKLLRSYTKEDVLGYYFLRMHKYYYRTLKEKKEELFKNFIYRFDINKKYDPIKWFKKIFNKKFKYGYFLEYSSLYNGKNALITQKNAYEHSRNRDITNIKNLYKLINKYNNILYIMGENHIYADKDVLVNTFGNYKVNV